ncbi:MAG: barstar family protein [Candidatus Accumulibacter sp.]|uniref:barstar family protein n=1 Tax=Accumulibacter sp. TaxID=2053492 RepID=UPI001A08E69D|nr:barstar family protein [Accumulibacter sp.]MBE2258633.1 barstar family protein [Paracoccaceae bacterium]MCB1943344.1 barstar family protein [Accumulibacter sp.]MCP5246991.1 barstar family protein [Accumulibacter sp.]
MAISLPPLQRLLENPRYAGIYHLPLSGQAALKAAAAAAGFAVFEVGLGDADRIDEVLAKLGHDLDLPRWYGQNYDALKDCLSDFSWHEAPGYVVIVSRAETLAAENPAAFRTLNEVIAAVIDEWRSRDVPMWVFYDLRADGLASLPTLA